MEKLTRSDFDLVHASVVVGGKISGVQPEQWSAAFEVVRTVELPEVVVLEAKVELDSQLSKGRHAEVREIGETEKIAFRINMNFHRMKASIFGTVGWIAKVDDETIAIRGFI